MFNNITPVTKIIIFINVGIFLLSYIVYPNLMYYLAAYFPLSKSFQWWQIITHMFTHGGWMHLLFNMFTLLSFGPVLERVLGQKKYILFYFACGLGSFVIFNVWNYFQIQNISQELMAMNINPQEILEIGRRAREFVEREHDFTKITHKYLATWRGADTCR